MQKDKYGTGKIVYIFNNERHKVYEKIHLLSLHNHRTYKFTTKEFKSAIKCYGQCSRTL